MTLLLPRRQVLLGLGTLAAAKTTVSTTYAQVAAPGMNHILLGDWGRHGHYDQRRLGQTMGMTAERVGSQFTISMGDNFYEHGVKSVRDRQWQDSFQDIYTAPSLHTPWRIMLGNHDYRGNIDAQLAYGRYDPRWVLPARYYRVRDILTDGTTIDGFYLDTNPFISQYRGTDVRIDDQNPQEQLDWLQRELSASQADWKIVYGHHPIYNGDGKRGMHDMHHTVEPILKAHRVHLYICGHVHNLQYIAQDGVHYVINGAGSRVDAVGPAVDGAFTAPGQHGFMVARIERSMLRFDFIGIDGQTLFTQTIPRSA